VSQIGVSFLNCRWESATGVRSNTGGHVIMNFGYGNLGEASATGVPLTKNGGVFSVLSSAGSTLHFDGGGNGSGHGLELVGDNATTNVVLTARDNAALIRGELFANGTYNAYRAAGKGGAQPSESVSIDGINRKLWLGDGTATPVGFLQGVSSSRVDVGPAAVTFRSLGPLEAGGAINLATATGNYIDFREQTSAPAAGATDHARLYAEDNGAGKTRLVVRFPTGAAVVLATEP
jgi:hypothetical protein